MNKDNPVQRHSYDNERHFLTPIASPLQTVFGLRMCRSSASLRANCWPQPFTNCPFTATRCRGVSKESSEQTERISITHLVHPGRSSPRPGTRCASACAGGSADARQAPSPPCTALAKILAYMTEDHLLRYRLVAYVSITMLPHTF